MTAPPAPGPHAGPPAAAGPGARPSSQRIEAIRAWLVDGARPLMDAGLVLKALCDGLLEAGVPLWRVAAYVRTLHPQVMGRSLKWQPGADVVVVEAPFEMMETAEYKESPVVTIYATARPIRRRLVERDCVLDYKVLVELKEQGGTDYFAAPLVMTDGTIHVVTWSTRAEAGFSEADMAGIESVLHPLARVTEIRALRRTAVNLLDTYVGRQAGERILAGRIRRGDTERIHAAIWLSDMRGFTPLADRLPPGTLLDLLNRYFDCQVPAIESHGGEVLKYMGDGLLAIFPAEAKAGAAGPVCQRALAAALAARANVAALAAAAADEATRQLRFGLALHLGEVLYGNIGAGNRLDFTCIGPGVNLAARLEKLAARLPRSLVASSAFAQACGHGLAPIGEFELAGFSAREAVYGLVEEMR
jgi:adenylate cyclase